jgi:acylphosphatase
MSKKRVRATVHGRVQGVAFREYTRREAAQLGVSGWVCNQPNGTVTVLCEGEDSQVDALVAWLSVGSPFALVTSVDWIEEEPQGETGPLVIRLSC